MSEAYQDPDAVKGSDKKHADTSREVLRNTELPHREMVMEGLLPVGAFILFADPGFGKSFLAQKVEKHLADGTPWGPLAPVTKTYGLIIDFEGDDYLYQDRDYSLTPFGELPTDRMEDIPREAEMMDIKWGIPGSFEERMAWLDRYLTEQKAAGRPVRYVRIDTWGMWTTGKPAHANAYDWTKYCSETLNKTALLHDCAILILHHTNTSGELSGGMGPGAGVTVTAKLAQNTERPDEFILKSTKTRGSESFAYAIKMDDAGVWDFTEEITPTQAELTGTRRKIVDTLSVRGSLSGPELQAALSYIKKTTLISTCTRMRRAGQLIHRYGKWHLAQQEIPTANTCQGCHTLIDPSGDDGTGYHATCTAHVEAEPEAFYGDETAKEASQSAYKAMRESIAASRMKPLPCVPKDIRNQIPFNLVTEKMDGAHKWVKETLPDTGWVTTLDRTGSFPSACSSVPVAPNGLSHLTMPSRDDRTNQAGIFLITPPEWNDTHVGHPLGRTNRTDGEPIWVTSAHLEYLDKLVAQGLMSEVHVWEGWAGRRNTSLFERFSAWSRDSYAMEEGDERTARKRSASQAIRALWPKQAKSPFFRPDWNVAIRAEASVRHWDRAHKAVTLGGVLLRIGSTDEVAFWTEEKPDELWVPEPYKLGRNFGNVKIKAVETIDDWKGGLRGHGTR